MSETRERTIDLPDGRTLTIRRVTPADIAGLERLYGELTIDDLHCRFFSVYHPDRAFFERVVSAPDRGGYGLVAVVDDDDGHGDEPRLVAEAGYEPLPDGDGELAITVARDWRGWLGPVLLDALVAAAAERGVPNLQAEILFTNAPMLRLAWSRGAASMPSDTDDWTSLRLTIGTAGRTPVWPARPDAPERPRVLVETPGGRWHAGHEAAQAGLQVLACSGPRPPHYRCPALAGEPCPLAAEADAIVVSRAPDDERWSAIAASHGTLAPGVPVCIEPRVGHDDEAEPPPGVTRLPTGDARDHQAHERTVVTLVDRLARHHATTRRPPDERTNVGYDG